MPINIPSDLPAKGILEGEKIFALEDDVAKKQDIRPLKIAILNLMPKKIETETQILRLISKYLLISLRTQVKIIWSNFMMTLHCSGINIMMP